MLAALLHDLVFWNTVPTRSGVDCTGDDAESGSMCRTQDLVVEEGALGQRQTEMGAEGADRVDFALDL